MQRPIHHTATIRFADLPFVVRRPDGVRRGSSETTGTAIESQTLSRIWVQFAGDAVSFTVCGTAGAAGAAHFLAVRADSIDGVVADLVRLHATDPATPYLSPSRRDCQPPSPIWTPNSMSAALRCGTSPCAARYGHNAGRGYR